MDLISRQDAIDAVNRYDFEFPQYMERFVTELRDAMKADIKHDLEDLPSVDVVPTEFHDKCMEIEIEKRMNMEREKGEWIPCSERLPKEETDVLVCNVNGDIEISSGSYSTEMKDYFIWYTSGWRFGEPIAWMPLPAPYTESEVEE